MSNDIDKVLQEEDRCTLNKSRLIRFLYELMDNHLSIAAIEKIVSASENTNPCPTGWIVKYAEDVADRLNK